MRALIIFMSLPYPPASGGAIRVHGIIEGLHRAGIEITLLCFHDRQPDTNEFPHIHIETIPYPGRSLSQRIQELLFTNQPDIFGRFYVEAFANRLKELLAEHTYDLIQFEGIESVCYLPVAKAAQPTAKLCFDTFNAEFALQRGIFEIDRRNIKRLPAAIYSYIQSKRIYRYEREMCQLADFVVAVSHEDADLLASFRDDQKVSVVPNGIWVDSYTSEKNTLTSLENMLIFTGKMDYRPNVDAMLWFTESILPRIQVEIPNIQLTIVGQQPHNRLAHLTEQPNIKITGWVDSVLPYLQAATIYIAPLRMGSGTRLKLLEAMAAGCAIVATSAASAGLRDEAKQAMMIVDDEADMAKNIKQLLKDPEKRITMGEVAIQQVRKYYDWSALIPLLLDTYQQAGLILG